MESVKAKVYDTVLSTLSSDVTRVFCTTCRLVFLEISTADYIRLSKPPDKWLIETAIHYCECPDHVVVMVCQGTQKLISETWKRRQAHENVSLGEMLQRFLRHREENQHKAI